MPKPACDNQGYRRSRRLQPSYGAMWCVNHHQRGHLVQGANTDVTDDVWMEHMTDMTHFDEEVPGWHAYAQR
jgi:hypothetical protein